MKAALKKKRFKGFTLVEVMTSLVIMTILIAVASGVIMVTFDIFGRSAVRRAAQNNGNNVYNYIYDHLSYATALKIDQSVDINNKDSMLSLIGEGDDAVQVITEPNESGSIPDPDFVIVPYYEKIKADRKKMSVKRKGINADDVYIYGKKESGEGTGTNENAFKSTMNGCDCVVSFKKYVSGADTIEFSVTIERDDEVFYEKSGSIPILNEKLKDHIDIGNDISDNIGNIEIFYTYIW
ncbi:prepilin-type N-terminal cleavage/methylation domain-containing protein [Ruminococcus sp. HUN007]|uniref:type II secretion system protein n=1 Tax=Ruminococcus sp. HUN007 TaxID=1514668 RepID=UPI0005D139EA|nr:prepilin-type N-terminal cleavage/methylation domain-containing protein [Ruminococcus sp. HUN007]